MALGERLASLKAGVDFCPLRPNFGMLALEKHIRGQRLAMQALGLVRSRFFVALVDDLERHGEIRA